MSIDLRTSDRHWVIDATWVSLPRKPRSDLLRRQARALRATHYVTFGDRPCLVGFFDFHNYGQKRKTVNALAPVLAKALGPGVYAEIALEDGSIWILATDQASQLQPGSDRVTSADHRETLRKRYDEQRFPDRRTIDSATFDQLIASLKEEPARLHDATLHELWKPAFAGIVLLGLGYEALHLWHVHEARVREEARQAALAADRIRAENERRLHAPIAPSEWVQTCMEAAMRQPVFNEGWTQTSWSCTGSTLALNWARTGGTLANAPSGSMSANGNAIVQSVRLVFHHRLQGAAGRTDGLFRLIAYLQSLDIQPQIGMTPAGPPTPGAPGAIAATPVTWQFPTDPRSEFWDTVSGLSIQSLSHDNGISAGGRTVNSATIYSFTASVALPILVANHS